MSEMAKAARAAMKKKAASMSSGEPRAKVDASTWTPPEMMNTGAKTGLRPISRRAYKKGGKVVAVAGKDAVHHAGKKPRKACGGEAEKYANAKVNRNVKDANAEFGKPHVGGMKKGGRAHKMGGGETDPRMNMVKPGRLNFAQNIVTPGMKKGGKADVAQDKKLIKKAVRQHETAQHGGKHSEIKLKKGGRTCKADGGDISGISKRLQALQDERLNVDTNPTSETGEALFGGAKEAALRSKRKMAALKAAEDADAKRRGPSGDELAATAPARYRAFRSKKPFQSKELPVRDKLMNKLQGVDSEPYAKGGKAKANNDGGTRPTGGRIARKAGGRAKKKGKTNINIVINSKPDSAPPSAPPGAMAGPPPMPPRPPMMPPGPPPGMAAAPPPMPMPPPGGHMGPPPGGMPGPSGGQMPPHLAAMLGRKSGGRVGRRGYKSYKDMDAGAGGGLGRLEKTEIQKRK